MANIKSAKKRILTSAKRAERNKAAKSEVKTYVKKVDAAVTAGDKAAAEVAYKAAVKAVDQGVNKGIVNKNAAARKKSSLTVALNNISEE